MAQYQTLAVLAVTQASFKLPYCVAEQYDAVVVGSGPNGLTAAVVLALHGLRTHVIEGHSEAGGGTRTRELTLPGFQHDVCSAVHTMGCLSPAFTSLQLESHGLEWIYPDASAAHPLDDQPAALLLPTVEATAQRLGVDAQAYTRFVSPFLEHPEALISGALAPLGVPKHPWLMARFALRGLPSVERTANRWFKNETTKALLAGCAAHSVLPLDRLLTTAVGLMFLVAGHMRPWPVAKGGSRNVTRALETLLLQNGGSMELERPITRWSQLPSARCYLFDTAPKQLSSIAGDALPARYRQKLDAYRMGPGVFKLDWALDGPIPWSDPECLKASTVHVGGTVAEIAQAEQEVWQGKHPKRPFVMLTQQSQFDPNRAPTGQHTGYAYCHVPHDSDVDVTEAIEAQVERFAPGFHDRILARHKFSPADFERYNAAFIGGAITGGVADLRQLFFRPVARIDPYSTPNPQLFICSQSTPPGGGIHGMCGWFAARSALRRCFGIQLSSSVVPRPRH